MNETIFKIKNMTVWYSKDKNVLSDFSIELRKNEVIGLIGLNGAGKTTFIKTVSGLINTYKCDGIWMHEQSTAFRNNDFKLLRYTVFAEDNSFQYFTFREYLSYVLKAYRKKETDISNLIKGFNFDKYTDVLLKDLSTGNRKKAYLITAFALKPELLILDEPVNGLDFESTEFLYELLTTYKEYGTVLFSSHILESITLTCDKVFILEEGKINLSLEHEDIDAEKIREALKYDHDV